MDKTWYVFQQKFQNPINMPWASEPNNNVQDFSCLWPKKIKARRDLKNHLTVNTDNFRDGKSL